MHFKMKASVWLHSSRSTSMQLTMKATWVVCVGEQEQLPSKGSQIEGKAAIDPEHVALNVDIPADDATFMELHEVSLLLLHYMSVTHADLDHLLVTTSRALSSCIVSRSHRSAAATVSGLTQLCACSKSNFKEFQNSLSIFAWQCGLCIAQVSWNHNMQKHSCIGSHTLSACAVEAHILAAVATSKCKKQ